MTDSFLQQFRNWQLPGPPSLTFTPQWRHNTCQVRIENSGNETVQPQYLDLFSGVIPPDAEIYGEGFQMLAQTAGRCNNPQALGRCPDAGVYRLSEDAGKYTVYNFLVACWNSCYRLLGFSSCQRFSHPIQIFTDGRITVQQDTEHLCLAPGESWRSEHLVILEADDLADLMTDYAALINLHHPRLTMPSLWQEHPPAGWCSWYHYYADITESDITENLEFAKNHYADIDTVLIDDGYQAHMGDWLLPSARFAGGVAKVIQKIIKAGKIPAIWVAPFIAESSSAVFQQHPEWFVKNESGQPIAAEEVTYGGWRCTPWYCLDTTQPAVIAHLKHIFHTMYQDWGVRYFKLDGNYWGTLPFACRQNQAKTRIQAYREAMQAILAATEDNAFILGCNAPVWPSLGLVHGMRVGDDVERSLQRFQQISRECFARHWQHRRLWLNDPDCVTLQNIPGQHTDSAAYHWHRCALLTSGALIFSGDRLSALHPANKAVLETLLRDNPQPARFADHHYQVAIQNAGSCLRYCLFNWQDQPIELRLPARGRQWQLFWPDDRTEWYCAEDSLVVKLAGNSATILSGRVC